ncbi:NAD(P)H-dependent flavin oxidoreductase [Halobacillus halophilus]|uniref:NAD(P)H-dependent flavin oxidoreductase n=1 Tax=Halobacillus halophilus TaxID=1570 RepID=UPI001CD588B3|nr:nitronate monooxygenase [Halobacillus halophilus]MCA1009562.1 nitronate monooxygenase [Halobacillus halophilus]
MWYKNEVIKTLNCDYPIIQAGMAGGVTTPELVASVSNEGGMGTIGAGYLHPDELTEKIMAVQQSTSKTFGVNMFVPETPRYCSNQVTRARQLLQPYEQELQIKPREIPEMSETHFEEQVNTILKLHVPVCSFTFGVPDKTLVKELHKNGVKVIGTATTVEEAVINEQAGVDIITAQGSEAGGHRGTFHGSHDQGMIGTMSLVPQMVDEVGIPVLAAGGIMDERGIAASLMLGAQGVQMGTAFVTSLESGAKEQHKQAILQAKESDTTITSVFSGKPARGLENEFIKQMKPYQNELPDYPIQNELTKNLRKKASERNRPEWMSLWSGQSPRLSGKKYVSQIIKELVDGVERLYSNRGHKL